MRVNRLIKIYPDIEPKLKAIAFLLLKNSASYLEVDDLLQEGLLAIKACKTTKKKPHTLSYLIQRAKFTMVDFVQYENLRLNKEIITDFTKYIN